MVQADDVEVEEKVEVELRRGEGGRVGSSENVESYSYRRGGEGGRGG